MSNRFSFLNISQTLKKHNDEKQGFSSRSATIKLILSKFVPWKTEIELGLERHKQREQTYNTALGIITGLDKQITEQEKATLSGIEKQLKDKQMEESTMNNLLKEHETKIGEKVDASLQGLKVLIERPGTQSDDKKYLSSIYTALHENRKQLNNYSGLRSAILKEHHHKIIWKTNNDDRLFKFDDELTDNFDPSNSKNSMSETKEASDQGLYANGHVILKNAFRWSSKKDTMVDQTQQTKYEYTQIVGFGNSQQTTTVAAYQPTLSESQKAFKL